MTAWEALWLCLIASAVVGRLAYSAGRREERRALGERLHDLDRREREIEQAAALMTNTVARMDPPKN